MGGGRRSGLHEGEGEGCTREEGGLHEGDREREKWRGRRGGLHEGLAESHLVLLL